LPNAWAGRAPSSSVGLTGFAKAAWSGCSTKRRGKGTPIRLTAEAAQALREKLAAGGWRRAADAQRWLAEAHGVEVGLGGVSSPRLTA
jgi:hypothetical protein